MKCCTTCDTPGDVRPYGLGGVLVCFKCAMSTPEGTAIAEYQFVTQLEACGTSAALGPQGLYPLEHAAPKIKQAVSNAQQEKAND